MPLSRSYTESPVELQEFFDNSLKLSSKESSLNVKEVITQLPSISAESPTQFRTEPVKKILQYMIYIVCLKAGSTHKCKSCDKFVYVICVEIDPKKEG